MCLEGGLVQRTVRNPAAPKSHDEYNPNNVNLCSNDRGGAKPLEVHLDGVLWIALLIETAGRGFVAAERWRQTRPVAGETRVRNSLFEREFHNEGARGSSGSRRSRGWRALEDTRDCLVRK